MSRCRPFSAAALVSLALLGLTWLATGCTDATVQPISEEQNSIVDNLLQIDGEVCTSPPTEQVFPVKIMFIVDTSGSMQFTDPSDKAGDAKAACLGSCAANTTLGTAACASACSNADNPGRRQAVEKVIERFRNNPVVSFAIISFNGRIQVNGGTTEGFTNKEGDLQAGLQSLMEADITTDYQGALSTAYQILEKDMLDTNPVERGRTKYVVMFLSDGGPNPVCKEGCGNDEVDIGVVVDSWCDVPRDQWCDNFNANTALCQKMEQWYPSMVAPCRAYNTEQEIVKKVNEIMDLGENYGAGEIRLHTAFLFVDALPKAIRDLFYDPLLTADQQKQGAEDLLKKMAVAGDGLYRSFNSGQSIDFLDINYTSVARPFGITNFIVSNMNALPAVNRLEVDSDGDGVADSVEFDTHIGMDDRLIDSDGDGYNDKLEYDRRDLGFDPGDPKLPVRVCRDNERKDRDGDGLLDCEEAILGTDPKIADTDRDRIPDGIEFLFGTDPRKADAKLDPDFDGKLSDHEINIHSNPTVADPEVQANYKYIYDVQEQPPRPDLRKCYAFKVRRVRLVTTKQRSKAGTVGYNDIMVYFGEGPADDPRDYGSFQAACVRAQYVEPSYKYPADGRITLTPKDFYKLEELVNRKKIAETDPTADPCAGAPLP